MDLKPVDRLQSISQSLLVLGFPCSLIDKDSACSTGDPQFGPWVGKIPWRRKWQPTPAFSPGKSHGQRSLVGCRPWGCNGCHSGADTGPHGARHTVSKRQGVERACPWGGKGARGFGKTSLESHPASCLGRSQPLSTSLSFSGELPSSGVWTQKQPPGPRQGRGQCQKDTWLPCPFLEMGLPAQRGECCWERRGHVWRVPCFRAPLRVQLEASL